jgi:hypothetical protein
MLEINLKRPAHQPGFPPEILVIRILPKLVAHRKADWSKKNKFKQYEIGNQRIQVDKRNRKEENIKF